MSPVHVCNTFFEKELEAVSKKDLIGWLRSHPIVLQLQFLPLLYAGPEDPILVSDLPDHPDPRLCLLNHPPKPTSVEHWGFSLAISDWAKKKDVSYPIPPWELVRLNNSKIFSFNESLKLPGAALLETRKEIEEWIEKGNGPQVLKTPFGAAGGGHFHVGRGNLNYFLQKHPPPLIGEPWVERVLDFSTQWKDGKLLGTTVFETEENGTYKATLVGKNIMGRYEWALEKHLEAVEGLVEKIGKMGYWGHFGIDAYVYKREGKEIAHPVVEINGRKTMSWIALEIHRKRECEKRLRLSFSRETNGLLPNELTIEGRKIRFQKQITLFAY